jgi:hypothetical protein
MKASDYIKKCRAICGMYKPPENCGGCPIINLGCGIPDDPDLVKKAVETVREFNLTPPPYVCPECDTGGHSENALFCNICGAKLEKH